MEGAPVGGRGALSHEQVAELVRLVSSHIDLSILMLPYAPKGVLAVPHCAMYPPVKIESTGYPMLDRMDPYINQMDPWDPSDRPLRSVVFAGNGFVSMLVTGLSGIEFVLDRAWCSKMTMKRTTRTKRWSRSITKKTLRLPGSLGKLEIFSR